MRLDRTAELDPDHDYIKVQIRKLAQFVAHLLGRASKDYLAAQARDELAGHASQLLGHPYEILEQLSPGSATQLFGGDFERALAYADVVAAEAELYARMGNSAAATRKAARAHAIRALVATSAAQPLRG